MTAKPTDRQQSSEGAGGDTKERVLDAAEKLIAEYGPRAVSIREITKTAGVNLAAINYHFGSKENLLRAVLRRRMLELHERRLQVFDGLEEKMNGGKMTIEMLLDIFLRTIVDDHIKSVEERIHHAKMMGRFFLEEEEMMRAVGAELFEINKKQFISLFRKVLSNDISNEELGWRAVFVMGVLNHHIIFSDMQKHMLRSRISLDEEINRVVAFCAAGLQSPPNKKNMKKAQK